MHAICNIATFDAEVDLMGLRKRMHIYKQFIADISITGGLIAKN